MDFFTTFLIIFATTIITAWATFNYVILYQEIEETPEGYEVTILNNNYYYE